MIVTGLGLALCFFLGWKFTGNLAGALSFLLIGGILSILEISLSFDNAIVNANKLKTMSPVWQKRFLTWGILIAVFGMRVVFPLLVVTFAAHINPFAALHLAISQPDEYARMIHESHLSIAAFGGTFLMMVALSYFMNKEKDVHWFRVVEEYMCKCASIRGLQIGMVLAIVLVFAVCLPDEKASTFLFSAAFGLVTFIAVDLVGRILDKKSSGIGAAARGGLGAFLYLEVLDASFSFDGVIGAFALTQNLFLIAIGLGIGAMYVRGMTIMLVEKNTLKEFRYLEHGAFYSILVLAIIMFVQALTPVPEYITGSLGAGFILVSLMSSMRYKKRQV
ncbi:MAG: DUF475 domain-containing protein [Rhodobacteraceae bacterium]|nr:DUF475 domain-containing protein [Paracoccaceae bacterium]